MWTAEVQLHFNPGIDAGVPDLRPPESLEMVLQKLPGFRYYLQARAVMFGLSVIPEAMALMYQMAARILCQA